LRTTFRAYAALNDFLAGNARHRATEHDIDRRTSVKDFVERVGIPHPEIDLLLRNGTPASFDDLLKDGDRVAAFPRFFTIDVSAVTRTRPATDHGCRFVLDVHLGRLARHMRLAGIDTRYAIDADDDELARTAAAEHRILLTRDIALLKRRGIARGYFVRATAPDRQFVEILRQFSPVPVAPFSRCVRCNGMLKPVPKDSIAGGLLPRTREHYDEFWKCTECDRVFWKGAHYARLTKALRAALDEAGICDGPDGATKANTNSD
jgi:uncharacterized protein